MDVHTLADDEDQFTIVDLSDDPTIIDSGVPGPQGIQGIQGEQGPQGEPGVDDHGLNTGLGDDDHLQYLHKDVTRHITVGYTSDADAVGGVPSTFTPDVTLEIPKTGSVESNFTLTRPTSDKYGRAILILTVDAIGEYTMSQNNVTIVSGIFNGAADKVNVIDLFHRGTTLSALAWITVLP